jgi:hypothetical protein
VLITVIVIDGVTVLAVIAVVALKLYKRREHHGDPLQASLMGTDNRADMREYLLGNMSK